MKIAWPSSNMAAAATTIILALSSSLYWPGGDAAKILLAPYLVSSHVIQHLNVGEALVDQKHEVYISLSDSYPGADKAAIGRIKILPFRTAEPDYFSFDEAKDAEIMEKAANIPVVEDFRTITDGFVQLCTNPLGDQDYYKKLKSMAFDLAIVDIFPGSRCLLVLMYRLDVPYVGMATLYEPWLSRSPALPSFVPFVLGTGFTEKMTFWQRFTALWEILDWHMFPRCPFVDDNLVTKYAPEKPAVSLNHLAGKCLLYLIKNDIILDYPRPLMPNEIFMGGVTNKPAKPLPTDLEQLVNSAPEGIIVVSFGSLPAALVGSAVPKFIAAFKQLKQHVFWRFSQKVPSGMPSNVHVMKWLPQNDLLGHSKTLLFITHCGSNGQFEALYHSVPMIGFPSFSDQKYNAARMEYHRMGIRMDVNNFEVDKLVANIQKVITDKSYKESIQKRSEIYKNQPMKPLEIAVYWIEHVLKYGGDHLRSHALDMPWYQYLMLDILVFVLIVVHIVIGLTWFTCRLLWATIRNSDSKLKTN